MRRLTGWTLGITLLSALWASAAVGQGPPDPRTLVGVWEGVWTLELAGLEPMSGAYQLSITRVEGRRVVGRIHSAGVRGRGGAVPGVEADIQGTLDGNRLTYGSGPGLTELVIEGDRMEGTRAGRGAVPHKIALKKR